MSGEKYEAITLNIDQGNRLKSNKKISHYNKKQIINNVKERPQTINKDPGLFKRIRIGKKDICGFVSSEARVCQKRHEQKMKTQNNQRYLNLNRCAKDLSNSNDIPFTDNALPVTLEAIKQFENLPTPEQVNGVDLKILYETIANLMAGYPVNEIEDGPTKEFLYQCYSDVINSVESTTTKKLEENLLQQDEITQPIYSWLCNSNYDQYLEKLLKNRVQEFTVQIE